MAVCCTRENDYICRQKAKARLCTHLTLEGIKGKWRWIAQNAVDASGKDSWGYLQSGVTADDTYHNLTVTAPSSSDYALERTLTSVSFYPTETYYIMNYKAMCGQQMTATNTVQPRWFLSLSCGVDTMTEA